MASTINTNVYSMNAQRNLNKNQQGLSTALERLSSGLRINSSKDDAAGLAIAGKMESDARGLTVAIRNASDGISFAQTADGALGTVGDILQRMNELAVQSLNGTLGNTERGYLDKEFQELRTQMSSLQGAAKLNGIAVFSATAFKFQVGTTSGDTLSATFTSAVAISGAIATSGGASAALTAIATSLAAVATNRATIGGSLGALGFRINQLETSRENQFAARGRIMDTDFAVETSNLSRSQILQQAGTAMVAQANAVPQGVLALLR